MFFAPTLQALTAPACGNHVKVLCLSSGDADGLGAVRQKELVRSAVGWLGVRREEDVFVLGGDDGRFVDGLDRDWAVADVAGVLGEAFAPGMGNGKRGMNGKGKGAGGGGIGGGSAAQDKPAATIDVLITFDQGGVSNHPNHRALYGGAVLFLKNLMRGYGGWECPVALYTLPTVNVVRKYSGVCDAVVTMAVGAVENLVGGFGRGDRKKQKGGGGSGGTDGRRAGGQGRVLFVSGLQRYWRARQAMVQGHRSQMVWFRWGWITIGRYMVVNDLKRERIAAS